MNVSKNVKIGITAKCDENIFGNGLNQNVWFLHRLLKGAGYDVYLVSESKAHAGKKLITENIHLLTPENIVVRSNIDVFEPGIFYPEFVGSFKVEFLSVVVGNKSGLIDILPEIFANIVDSNVIMINIIFAGKTHKPGTVTPKIARSTANKLPGELPGFS